MRSSLRRHMYSPWHLDCVPSGLPVASWPPAAPSETSPAGQRTRSGSDARWNAAMASPLQSLKPLCRERGGRYRVSKALQTFRSRLAWCADQPLPSPRSTPMADLGAPPARWAPPNKSTRRWAGGSALGQPLKEADQVVQTPEVPVLAVALCPRQSVAERLVVRQGYCLAEVDHPDPGQTGVVVHKEEGAAHHLQGERREVRGRGRQVSGVLDSLNSGSRPSGFKSWLCHVTG